jgi:hypothetical protein
MGLRAVGEQFEQGEMFLPDLVLAGEAMKAAAAGLEPAIHQMGATRETLGKVVLGSVKGEMCRLARKAESAALGALGGINMISGAGMLDSLACHRAEKLVLDAESMAVDMRRRPSVH